MGFFGFLRVFLWALLFCTANTAHIWPSEGNVMCMIAPQVVAGGGAVEAALSVYLENLATTLGSREQLAIAEFAEALLIIPRVLLACCPLNPSQLSFYDLSEVGE